MYSGASNLSNSPLLKTYYHTVRKSQVTISPESPALFLSPCTNPNGNGRLTVKVVNDVWNEVCKVAGIEGRTPHSARRAMGRYIIEKTGNVAAVQRQLGHKNAAYSMQYSRITDEELNVILDGR